MPTASFLTLVAKDRSRVNVCLPGHKLTASDRYGEEPWCIHERVKKCIREVAIPKLGYDANNKDANERSLSDITLWKDIFLYTGDLPANTLITSRQLALDFAASDAAELFGVSETDSYDPVKKTFRCSNDQVAAFLAAKELLPDNEMKVFMAAYNKALDRAPPKKKSRTSILTAAPPPALSLRRFPELKSFVTDPELRDVSFHDPTYFLRKTHAHTSMPTSYFFLQVLEAIITSVSLTGASKCAEASNKRNERNKNNNGWAELYDNLFGAHGLLENMYRPLADVSALKTKIKGLWDVIDAAKDNGKIPVEVIFQATKQKQEHEIAVKVAQKEREAAIEKAVKFQEALSQIEVQMGAVPIGIGGHLPKPLLTAAVGRTVEESGRAVHSTNLSMRGPPENIYVTTKRLVEEQQQHTDKENGRSDDNTDENGTAHKSRGTDKIPGATKLFINADSKLKDLSRDLKNAGTEIERLIASIKEDDQQANLATSIKQLATAVTQQQSALAQQQSALVQQQQIDKKKQYLQAAELYAKMGMNEEAKKQLNLYQEACDEGH